MIYCNFSSCAALSMSNFDLLFPSKNIGMNTDYWWFLKNIIFGLNHLFVPPLEKFSKRKKDFQNIFKKISLEKIS